MIQKELNSPSALLIELEQVEKQLNLLVQHGLNEKSHNLDQSLVLMVEYLDEYIPYIDGAIIEKQKSKSVSLWRTWLGSCIVQLHRYGWINEQKRLRFPSTQNDNNMNSYITSWMRFQKELGQRVRMCIDKGYSLNLIYVESPFYPFAYLSLDELIAMVLEKEKQCLRVIDYGKTKGQP